MTHMNMNTIAHDHEPRDGEQRRRLAVVDDDAETREMLALVFEEDGFEVITANCGEELIERLLLGPNPEPPLDVVVSDVCMRDGDGLDLLRCLNHLHPVPAAVLITGYATEEVLYLARSLGALDVLPKPVDISELIDLVHQIGH